jgi:hypothetical protein
LLSPLSPKSEQVVLSVGDSMPLLFPPDNGLLRDPMELGAFLSDISKRGRLEQ